MTDLRLQELRSMSQRGVTCFIDESRKMISFDLCCARRQRLFFGFISTGRSSNVFPLLNNWQTEIYRRRHFHYINNILTFLNSCVHLNIYKLLFACSLRLFLPSGVMFRKFAIILCCRKVLESYGNTRITSSISRCFRFILDEGKTLSRQFYSHHSQYHLLGNVTCFSFSAHHQLSLLLVPKWTSLNRFPVITPDVTSRYPLVLYLVGTLPDVPQEETLPGLSWGEYPTLPMMSLMLPTYGQTDTHLK